MNPAVNTNGWRARLEQALKDNLQPDDAETKELSRLSGEWETCAVGENLEVLKEKGYPFEDADGGRKTLYPPISLDRFHANPVSNLGLEFDHAVGCAYWGKALRILDKIEALPTLDEYISKV